MGEQEYRYDAFISYRHAETDQFAAENLHRLLETFRVPGIAADTMKGKQKKQIKRVFRDRDELPLSSNLSDNILEALKASEFLIVICSPRTKQSEWVRKEITTFIALHGREHVLAVLIEGEPEDSFPEEIRYEERRILTEEGTEKSVPEEVEPLAADIRAENKRRMRKKLKKELLRIAAPILGCGYDDLRQRHRERRMKRLLLSACAAAGIFLLFGSVSTIMALRIQRQSALISEQSGRIEAQYKEAMERQSRTLADTSLRLLAEGDRIAAVLVALEALPGENRPDMPYTERAQYALTEALHVYENGSATMPAHLLKMDTTVSFTKISPDGSRLLAADIAGKVMVWDAASGRLLYSAEPAERQIRTDEARYGFLDDDRIYRPSADSLAVYRIETGEELYRIPVHGGYSCTVNGNAGLLAVYEYAGQRLLEADAADGQVLFEYSDEDWQQPDAMAFSPDGNLLACAVLKGGWLDEGVGELLVFDAGSGECTGTLEIGREQVTSVLFTQENELIVAANELFDTGMLDGGRELGTARIRMLEPDLTGLRWSFPVDRSRIETLMLSGDGKEVIYQDFSSVGILRLRDGAERMGYEFDSMIAGCMPLGTRNVFGLLRDGASFFASADTGEVYRYDSSFVANSDNVEGFKAGEGYYAANSYEDNAITIYETALGAKMEGLGEFFATIDGAVLDSSGRYCLLTFYENSDTRHVMLFDKEEKAKKAMLEARGYSCRAVFLGEEEEKIAVVTDREVLLYDREGKLLYRSEFDGRYQELLSIDAKGGRIAAVWNGRLRIFEIEEGKQEKEILLKDSRNKAAVGERMGRYAEVDEEEGSLSVYNIETGELENSMAVNAAFLSSVFMDGEERYLFVAYQDNTVEAYDAGTLELVHLYTELDDKVESCRMAEGQDSFLLCGNNEAYLCKSGSYEVIARIPGYRDGSRDGSEYIIRRGNVLAQAPAYTVGELQEEAARQLDGRTLSEEQRRRYHID